MPRELPQGYSGPQQISYDPGQYPPDLNVANQPGYYGELGGYYYDPWRQEYFPDPNLIKEDALNRGLIEEEKKPSMGDQMKPIAIGAGTSIGLGLLMHDIYGRAKDAIVGTQGTGNYFTQDGVQYEHMTDGTARPVQIVNNAPAGSDGGLIGVGADQGPATGGSISISPESQMSGSEGGIEGSGMMSGENGASSGGPSMLGPGLQVGAGLLGLYRIGQTREGGTRGTIQGAQAGAAVGSGASTIAGAQLGSEFGPWGAIAGAIAGGIYGNLAGKSRTTREDEFWRKILKSDEYKDIPREQIPFWDPESGQQEFDHRGSDKQYSDAIDMGVPEDFVGYWDDPHRPGSNNFINMKVLKSGDVNDLAGGDISQSATATARFGPAFYQLSQAQRDELGEVVLNRHREHSAKVREEYENLRAEMAKNNIDPVDHSTGMKTEEGKRLDELSKDMNIVTQGHGMISVRWDNPELQQDIENYLVNSGLLTPEQLEEEKRKALQQTSQDQNVGPAIREEQ